MEKHRASSDSGQTLLEWTAASFLLLSLSLLLFRLATVSFMKVQLAGTAWAAARRNLSGLTSGIQDRPRYSTHCHGHHLQSNCTSENQGLSAEVILKIPDSSR